MNDFNYCPNCGQRVDGNPKFCVKCGKSLEINSSENISKPTDKKELSDIEAQLIYANEKKNCVVGFALALFFGPLGLFYAGSLLAIIFCALPFVAGIIASINGAEDLDIVLSFQMVGILSWIISIIVSFLSVDNYNYYLKRRIQNRKK